MRSIRQFWMLGLTSPIIYLVIALVVNRAVFARRESAGFRPMPEPTYSVLFGVLALSAIASSALVFLLKRKWADAARRKPETEDEVFGILDNAAGRRFMILFMICDTIALLGLILFLIQGKLSAVLFFGIIALLAYAAACPRATGSARQG